ncbi:hypothetical protein GCM10023311_15790 [Flaviramulus aquimarinus]|uniref:Uncharacterized protein n=1 Tax=Flaviramulus aquimarinus TaxID=1170456 RepID=A0ABP9FB41_9FLAO
MNQKASTIHINTYYELVSIESFPSKSLYKTFINWVSGEFELFLQEKIQDLKIFFPGGWININEVKTHSTNFTFKIIVKSKYQEKGIQINNQIKAILSHLIRLKA